MRVETDLQSVPRAARGSASRRLAAVLLGLAGPLLAQQQTPFDDQPLGTSGNAYRPFATAEVLETELRIEVEMPADERSAAALQAGLGEALEVAELARSWAPATEPDAPPAEGSLRALNRAGGEALAIDPRLFDALERAQAFCVWSQQAHGPLGGALYSAWGLRRSAGGTTPEPGFLAQLVEGARCDRLTLDREAGTARLDLGTQLDLWGFERGLVVDRAVETMRSAGAANGWVRLGELTRAFGPGAGRAAGEDGPGWVIAAHPGGDERIEPAYVYLRDQSLSLASRQTRTLVIAGEALAPYIDQRTGRPVSDKLGVVAVTELAMDAEALSVALFIMNSREGEFRLGGLKPQPAVRWYFGSGTGYPLITERGWTQLRKWQPVDNPFRDRRRPGN